MAALSGMLPWRAAHDLQQQATRATLNRAMSSRHVADLRLLVSSMIVFLAVACALALVWWMLHPAWSDFKGAIAVAGAILTIGLSLINWWYQTSSKRLGIVDLFACELSAICRVYAIVDLPQTLIGAYKSESNIDFSKMTVHESYTPAMDKSVSDLENLDAATITAVTSFYTYRRAMIDFMFRLGQEQDVTRKVAAGPTSEAAERSYLFQIIYMLFLSLESARHAINELVEYEPDHAESVTNILLCELSCYTFLMTNVPKSDFRHSRLELRIRDYDDAHNKIHSCIERVLSKPEDDNRCRDWQKAIALWPALDKRYNKMVDECGTPPLMPQIPE